MRVGQPRQVLPAGRLARSPGSPGEMPEPTLAAALGALEQAGWTFAVCGAGSLDFRAATPARVARFLSETGRSLDPDTGDRVRLTSPEQRVYTTARADEVTALDFFLGCGDPGRLAQPELAKRLLELERQGLTLRPKGFQRLPDRAWGAYLALTRGQGAEICVERHKLFALERIEELEARLAPYRERLEHYRSVVLPEARRGHYRQFLLGDVFEALGEPVGGTTLERRGQIFLALGAAVREGPDASVNDADRTTATVRLYQDLKASGFAEPAVEQACALVRQLGCARARSALGYLWGELPGTSTYPEARREREEVYFRLLAAGIPAAGAPSLVERVVMRPRAEGLADRIEVLEAMLASGGGVADFETLLRYGDEDLRREADHYLSLLRALHTLNRAAEAAATWSQLKEGHRLGLLPGGFEAGLRRCLQGLLLQDAGTVPGTIEQRENVVVVGGVPVPRRGAPLAPDSSFARLS